MRITSNQHTNAVSILKTMFGLAAAVVASTTFGTVITIVLFALKLLPENNFQVPIPPNNPSNAPFQFEGLFGITLYIGSWALLVAAWHAAIFGFPAAIVGQYLKLVRWWSSILVGFILACLPYAGFELSRVDGVRTTADWTKLVNEMFMMGFFGAIGGFAFWLIWRWMSRFDSTVKNT